MSTPKSITLCHTQNQFSRRWTCQSGFQSIKEADEEALRLRQLNENRVTKVYPFEHNYPQYLQYCFIYYDLMSFPSIHFKN